MHQASLVHVGQSREHTSQNMPHPCHFQTRPFQELADVCVEALEDKANRRLLMQPPKEYDVHEFDNVGVARKLGVSHQLCNGVCRLF